MEKKIVTKWTFIQKKDNVKSLCTFLSKFLFTTLKKGAEDV